MVNSRTRLRRWFECLKLLRLEMFGLWKPRVFHHGYFLPDVIVSNTLTEVVYFQYVPGGFPPVSGGACRIPVWGFWILCNHKEIITYHLIINFFVRLICGGDPRRPPSAARSFSKNQNVLEGPNVLHTQFIYFVVGAMQISRIYHWQEPLPELGGGQ